MSRKVAIVGSGSFHLTAGIGAQIVDELRALGEDAVVLTRGKTEFDRFIATICMPIGLRCLLYPSTGGAENWQRDVEMARAADSGIAFVSLSDLESKRMTGTLHIVEKLLNEHKPVKMMTEVNGSLVWAAETEGANDE